tara:strand:+ start:571 stop:693 length:123 start_codon:yes stop_codon:yes gene_type:complete
MAKSNTLIGKREDIKAELQFDLIVLLDKWDYPPIYLDKVY